MELLSSQISPNPNQLNLVIHYGPGKSNFNVYIIPFDPSKAYHEYRFDWSPAKSTFTPTANTSSPSPPAPLARRAEYASCIGRPATRSGAEDPRNKTPS